MEWILLLISMPLLQGLTPPPFLLFFILGMSHLNYILKFVVLDFPLKTHSWVKVQNVLYFRTKSVHSIIMMVLYMHAGPYSWYIHLSIILVEWNTTLMTVMLRRLDVMEKFYQIQVRVVRDLS